MQATSEIHICITVSENSVSINCTVCGEQILHAATGDKINRQKALDLAWKLTGAHICPGRRP